MEGVLWKWTNYWNGWQTRWFVLENGILSYYKSQEEVNQGCKGSMKVQACEINVHSVDITRMDLVIPGEQHMYLRAATSLERQQWLVALGSAKACMQIRNKSESNDTNPDALKTKKSELRLYCDLLMQQVHVVKTAVSSTEEKAEIDIKKIDDATSLLGATCDTFIKTMEECMKLSNANLIYEQHTEVNHQKNSVQTNNLSSKKTKNISRLNSLDFQ